jgi:hypothetical protein
LAWTFQNTGAIARTNWALKIKYNQLANTRGGTFATGSHEFTHPHHPQYFLHTPAHQDRFTERCKNPTMRDKAILMADAMTGRTKAVLGTNNLSMIRHELKLQNLFSKIIPISHWRIWTADEQNFLSWVQETSFYTNNEYNWRRWLLKEIHIITIIIGQQPPSLLQIKCTHWRTSHTGEQSDELWLYLTGLDMDVIEPKVLNHSLKKVLPLPSVVFVGKWTHNAIACLNVRIINLLLSFGVARISQELIAEKLMQKYPSACFKHFIQQKFHASWTDATRLEKIWQGIWCPDTLKGLLSELTMSERYIYIKIASKLTAPLIDAYNQMLDINVKS